MIKTHNKRIINIAGKEGQLLKKFKVNENSFKTMSQNILDCTNS